MNITPITAPRIAPILGASTVSADTIRQSAIDKFNQGLVTAASPSQAEVSIAPEAVTSDLPITEQTTSRSSSSLEPTNPGSEEVLKQKMNAVYSQLARREKMIRQRESSLRARVAQSMAPQTPQAPAFDPAKYVDKSELINNPFGVLNTLGLSYEQLTQKALDAPSHEDMEQRREIAALRSQLDELKAGQEEVKKTFTDTQAQARQQAEMQIFQDVKRLISQDPSFEVTRSERKSGEVVKLITEVYDKGIRGVYPIGHVLDIADAAQMVENELINRGLRLAKLSKIQSRLNSNNAAQKQTSQTQQPTNTPALRTLTNAVGTPSRKLTNRERAMKVFHGEAV